jgi:molybdate transport system permease protein
MTGSPTTAALTGGGRAKIWRSTVSILRKGAIWGGPRLVAMVCTAFLLGPLLYLCVWPTYHQLMQALHSEMVLMALKVSLISSGIATLLVVLLGTALAYILARFDFTGKRVIDTLVDLPMVLPPMVTGLALLMVFGRKGPVGAWLGQFGIAITFTTIAVVLAQVFVALPFFVRAARAGFEAMDRRLELASLLLGASRLQTFLQVTVPITWPSLLAGIVLAWARCLGEFGATIVFAGNFQGTTQTMPLAIFSALQDDAGVAVAIALLLLGVSFVLLLCLKLFIGKRAVYHS